MNETNLLIDNKRIPWSNEVKYLGITLDKNIKFNTHAKNVRNKAAGIIQLLYPLKNLKNNPNINNKIKIYKSIIRPIMTYGAPCFIQSDSAIKILQTYEHKTIRKITGAPWYITNAQIMKDINFTNIEDFMKKLSKSQYETWKSHDNPIIRQITDDNPNVQKAKRSKLKIQETT